MDIENTKKLLRAFQCSPRVAGTERDAEIVRTISTSFQNLGYAPEVQDISFIGWRVVCSPKVVVVDSCRAVQCRLATWSGGTKGVDIEGSALRTGEMRFWGLGAPHKYEKWALVNGGVEHTEAFLIPNMEDHLVLPYPMEDIAYICLDPKVLRNLSATESRIRVSVKTEFLPGAHTANVIATKKGTSTREIIICAHQDTVYDDTNGLHDNGGACVVLLRLAQLMKSEKTHHTIKFIATGAEEFNILGARTYVKEREERGTMSEVRACIALDYITQSPEVLYIHCTPEFDTIGAEVASHQRRITGYGYELPERFDRYTFCVDAWAFQEKGIPAFYYSPYHPERCDEKLDAIAANITKNTDFVHQLVLATDRKFANAVRGETQCPTKECT